MLWRLQNLRLRAIYTRGACALAMVEQRQGARTKLLDEAARSARAIERARLAWMRPLAGVLRSGILLRKGAHDQALLTLEAAARNFAARDLSAHAAAAWDRALP